jgi:hypothetical protein
LIKRDTNDEIYKKRLYREIHDRLYGLQRISGHIGPLKEKKGLIESQLNKEQTRKSERIE